ncbi:hypothetical protein GCK72_013591 [Caenorhabditis remanei]|uniref:W02B3.4-like N-terminal domain-containing protein n=1 Tax=Caenorhabditis remanei TaxID=31234 RepID=A0A6A5GRH1_CAERE|nr:hypothetical protein GCK72_013591 [Caenorhabditis remanei]KAF1757136.1 hypothetical protein GCK72_013591 [Caenorhabditis remanei]
MRFKKHRLLSVIAAALIFLFILILNEVYYDSSEVLIDEKWEQIIDKRQREINESVGCHDFLQKLQGKVSVSVLLIDMDILEIIGQNRCNQLKMYETPIQVATNSRKDLNFIHRNLFEPFFFESNEQKDYLEFDTKPRRIIPKNFETMKFGNIAVPMKPFRFRKYWEKSRLIECSNTTMNRNEIEKKRRINLQSSVSEMSRLRDLLIQYDMYPFIVEETLLGWYRECSIIPHTQDIDFAIMATEFNSKFVNDMREGRTNFKLTRRLGGLDSLELTVTPRHGYKLNTNVFFMYRYKNETGGNEFNWISGLCGDGEKIRYNFPLFEPICSADFHDHLVWVTCDPKKAIIHEYGEKWYENVPTKNYSCYESVNNVERNVGWYSSWELRKVTFEDGYEYH